MANDLKSRDWLIYTTKDFLRTIDPSIFTDIQYKGDGGRILIVSNVSEETIDKLAFITNTDKNNNYGYLEGFSVYIKGEKEPVDLGDFSETVIEMYRSSDADGFLNGKKTHTPFSVSNLKNVPAFNTEGKRFADYVDFISGTLQGSRSTYGLVKLFTFVFNPDYIDELLWDWKYDGWMVYPTNIRHNTRVYTEYDVRKFLSKIFARDETIERVIRQHSSWGSVRNYNTIYRDLHYAYYKLKLDLKNTGLHQYKDYKNTDYNNAHNSTYAVGSTLPLYDSGKLTNENY